MRDTEERSAVTNAATHPPRVLTGRIVRVRHRHRIAFNEASEVPPPSQSPAPLAPPSCWPRRTACKR